MSRTAVIGPALVAAAPVAPDSCTLRDLAERANVGYDSARYMVPKLAAAGELQAAGELRVDYRNRPVMLYQRPPAPGGNEGLSIVDLQLMRQSWPG